MNKLWHLYVEKEDDVALKAMKVHKHKLAKVKKLAEKRPHGVTGALLLILMQGS